MSVPQEGSKARIYLECKHDCVTVCLSDDNDAKLVYTRGIRSSKFRDFDDANAFVESVIETVQDNFVIMP